MTPFGIIIGMLYNVSLSVALQIETLLTDTSDNDSRRHLILCVTMFSKCCPDVMVHHYATPCPTTTKNAIFELSNSVDPYETAHDEFIMNPPQLDLYCLPSSL